MKKLNYLIAYFVILRLFINIYSNDKTSLSNLYYNLKQLSIRAIEAGPIANVLLSKPKIKADILHIFDDIARVKIKNRFEIYFNVPQLGENPYNKSLVDLNIGKIGSSLPFGLPMMFYYPKATIRNRIALVSMDKNMLIKSLPDDAKLALAKQLGIKKEQLSNKLKDINIAFYNIAFGMNHDGSNTIKTSYTNLFYHPWVGLWHRNKNLLNWFDDSIDVAIFQPNGITPTKLKDDIDFGSFSDMRVYLHTDSKRAITYLSPNNAKVNIDNDRNFIHFWAIAVSKDKKYILAGNILFADTESAEDLLKQIMAKSNTIQALSNNINISINKNWLKNEDKQALKTWILNIVKSLS